MMLKKNNGDNNCAISLLPSLIRFFYMMLGGSKSKLAKHGENLEKVMSGLFFFEGVGSTLSVEIKSFV